MISHPKRTILSLFRTQKRRFSDFARKTDKINCFTRKTDGVNFSARKRDNDDAAARRVCLLFSFISLPGLNQRPDWPGLKGLCCDLTLFLSMNVHYSEFSSPEETIIEFAITNVHSSVTLDRALFKRDGIANIAPKRDGINRNRTQKRRYCKYRTEKGRYK